MATRPFTAADLEALKRWDTPTICNGLELTVPERRAIGFTVEPMIAADRELPPIVGLARTGLIRAKEKPRGPIPPREDWYDYVALDDLPTVAVLQDIDDHPGYGAFWGGAIDRPSGARRARMRDERIVSRPRHDRSWFPDYRRPDRAESRSRAYGPDALRCERLWHDRRARRRHPCRFPWRRRRSRRRRQKAARGDRADRAPREGDSRYGPHPRIHQRQDARGAEASQRNSLRIPVSFRRTKDRAPNASESKTPD